jgi:hypothetical protein
VLVPKEFSLFNAKKDKDYPLPLPTLRLTFQLLNVSQGFDIPHDSWRNLIHQSFVAEYFHSDALTFPISLNSLSN